jgi:predicted ATPase
MRKAAAKIFRFPPKRPIPIYTNTCAWHEPEAALSPLRQMAMLARIHELVQEDSQFIISTHSPILMAYPDSIIYSLSPEGIGIKHLEETDHYAIMKRFLNNKDAMLRELFDSGTPHP